jgi:hypothetical protein
MWKWPLPAHSARRRLGPDPQTGPAALEMDVLTPLAYGLAVALCLVIIFAAAPGENADISS